MTRHFYIPQWATALLLCGVSASTLGGDDWEFALSPLFLWGVSIDGDATINGNMAPLELEFSDDIMENMEAVFTVHFEAKHGAWGFFIEYQYVDLEPNAEAQVGSFSADVDIDFEETLLELGGSWAFHNSERTRWELLAGGRYTDQDITSRIEISSPSAGIQQNLKLGGGDEWWQAFGGVRLIHALSKNWTFIGRTDLGYGGSDNSAVNMEFMFDYRFREWGSAFIGARYLDYDYEDGNETGYAFDAKKQGPLAGVTLHW